MKKLTHILLAAGALVAASFSSHAQTAPSIAVVDVEKVFKQHYSFLAEQAKLKAQQTQAQHEMDSLQKQHQDLIDQYKVLQDQMNNPAMTDDAKKKTTSDVQAKVQEIRQKEQDMQTFANNARQEISQQYQAFQANLVEAISTVAVRIGKSHNATLVLNKAAPIVLFADPSYDITDEVISDINKNKPADAPTAPAPAAAPDSGAPSSAASAEGAPQFSVPGVTPSK